MENFNITEFITLIDTFYNNAFNKLILWGGLFVAILGIGMPIILQWLSQKYQTGKYIEMENNLKNEITKLIDAKTKSMENDTKRIIFNGLVPLSKKVHYSIGICFNTLGLKYEEEENFLEAIKYYLVAADAQFEAEEELDLKVALNNLNINYSKIIVGTNNYFDLGNLIKETKHLILKIEEKYGTKKYYDEIPELKKTIHIKSKEIKNYDK